MAFTSESSLTATRSFVEIRPLLRAVSIASDSKKLVLALLGLAIFWAGQRILAWVFGTTIPGLYKSDAIDLQVDLSWQPVILLASLVAEPFRLVEAPFASLFSRGTPPQHWFFTLALALWAVGVWGIFGGAITRIAVVQAAADYRVGLIEALRFSLKKSASLIGAPLTPIFGIMLFAAGCAIFGLISRIPAGIGSTFAAIFGFVPFLLAVVMGLILIGLALGWPLMIATVATEGEDAPDALSRSYSYVNQRLARYAAHLVSSGLIGVIGLGLVIAFARVVIGLADWGVGLGGSTLGDTPTSGNITWSGFVGLVVHAWVYSYFWSSAAIIYLILRRDVDGTTWHDVYLPSQDADTFAGDLDVRASEKLVQVETTEIA